MIQIVLADDHQMVLEGLGFILGQQQDMKVLAKVSNGKAVLDILQNRASEIDVTVLDVRMPEMDGVETVKKIKRTYPKAKILVLTGYREAKFMTTLIRMGVSGYMLKEHGLKELVGAIRKIAAGGEYFGESVSRTLIFDLKKSGQRELFNLPMLTKREKEILTTIVKGKKNREIASELFIAETTVSKHRQNIMEKTNTHNVVELIRFTEENRLLDD